MSDVGITVTGIPIGRVSGCAITYAHGLVPVAMVEFDPTTGDALIAGMNSFRRTPVNISVDSTLGTLSFDGFFDGLSFSQSPGGYTYTAIIKNNFQLLNYIYPLNLGLNPGSMQLDRIDLSSVLKESGGGSLASFCGVEPIQGENIVRFFLRVCRRIIEFQNTDAVIKTMVQTVKYETIAELLKNPKYKANLTKAMALLDSINTDAINAVTLGSTAGANNGLGWIGSIFNGSPSTLWDVIMSGLGYLGCTLVIGNSKAFVVPENTFVAIPEPGSPEVGQKSSTTNIMFPAQTASLSFNDNGFKDIGYAVLMASPKAQGVKEIQGFNIEAGFYSDPKATDAGVYIVPPPPFLSDYYADILVHRYGTESKKRIEQKTGNVLTEKPSDAPGGAENNQTTPALDTATEDQATKDEARKVLNGWAQIKYLQAKYGDRGGSVMMEFNPNLCPGTGGKAFTRSPGIFVDFFVDTISHQFAVSPGNSGKAITNLNFSSGRLSNDAPGVVSDDFYRYDYSKMSAVQKSFVGDIS